MLTKYKYHGNHTQKSINLLRRTEINMVTKYKYDEYQPIELLQTNGKKHGDKIQISLKS